MSDDIKTLGELLEAGKNDPELLMRSHRKVWSAISSPLNGEEPKILSEFEDVKRRRLYHDQPSQRKLYPLFAREFSGIEPELAQTAEFFQGAASGGVLEDRVLEIFSNPGCGKTTWLRTIADGMHDRSFYYLADCPWREHPFHAIPPALRKDIYSQWYYFRGELCHHCEEKLQKALSGKWQNFQVQKAEYRLSSGIGMLQVEGALSEPDRSGKIPESWHDIFRHANGGVLFIDLPSQPPVLRSMLARYVTDGTLKSEDQTDWWPDFALVSVSNKKLVESETDADIKRAFRDRVVTVTFRLVTDIEAELAIQQKQTAYAKPDFHFMPHIETAWAHLVAVSRLENVSSRSISRDDALTFYNGGVLLHPTNRKLLTEYSYNELRTERPQDGVLGITTREAPRLLAAAGQYHKCVGIQHLLAALREEVKLENGVFTGEIKSRTEDWLGKSISGHPGGGETGLMEKLYQRKMIEDLVRVWKGDIFDQKKNEYFSKYLDHVIGHVNKTKVYDKDSARDIDPSTSLLESVEDHLPNKLYGESKEDFRKGVVSNFPPRTPVILANHPVLEDAITKKIITEYRAEIRLAIIGTDPDPLKARKNLEKMKTGLQRLGYDKDCCWDNLLAYARRVLANN